MNIHELNSYNLADAVKFNSKLNPRIWQGEKMRPRVRETLLAIAEDFKQSLGLSDLEVKDITLSGSNAGFTYTPNSDIDLHLVVDIPQTDSSEVYRELFDAKKNQYNDEHNIKIGGYDVELYVQDANKPHHSQGVFSILNNDWVNIPKKQRSTVNDDAVNSKYELMGHKIESAIASNSFRQLAKTAARIKRMRQAGLDQHGELGPENLAYKMLRNQGLIEKLYAARTAARDRQLSLKEQPARSHVTYGYRSDLTTEDAGETWDGVSPTTQMFLNESDIDSVLARFFNNCIDFLEIENAPEMVLHHTTDWSGSTGSFGQFDPDNNVLHLATSGRHVLDILRTMAHELTHCKQNEKDRLPDNAGETGSWWEDEANAMAGRIMRHWAVEHPEMFRDVSLEESSGYIPTRAQAKDPRFVMALTRDVHPGQTGKEANKMALQTDAQGRPALLMKTANLQESLAAEFALFEQQDLFEIKMTGKNLRAEAAKTGAIAGMEFEMIVPNVEGGDEDAEPEPDWDYDESVGGISDAVDFFDDAGQNSRRDLERLRDRMQADYWEWLGEQFDNRWGSDEHEFVFNYLKENASESDLAEILGLDNDDTEKLETQGPTRQDWANATEKVVEESYGNYWYDAARESAQEDFNTNADQESEWLEDREIGSMREVMNNFGMVDWPHWNTPSGGDRSIEDVANDFQDAIGIDVQASGAYHSGQVDRPSPSSQHYVVEPDGSLEGDDYGDKGLEFVSPPLPIDVIINDLNKVKRWAKSYGCYTNDSTGLHINISVPNYSRENLDFVKLAILMGDEYVSDSFGRLGAYYAKSAMGMIRDNISSRPTAVAQTLEKMKTHMDTAASKAIHSGVTQKFTSINVKDGHIEFRSPGGDWLDENFDKIENTLLRFTVAMSAALNPEMYREEYLKKLYKLLNPSGQKDEYGDMIQEFAKYMASLQGDGKEADGKLSKETQQAVKDFRKAASQELMQKNLANKRKTANTVDNTVDQTPKYEIYNKQTGNPVETADGITNDAEALIRLNDYIEHGPHTLNRQQATAMFGIRPVGQASPTAPRGREYQIFDQNSQQTAAAFLAPSDEAALARLLQYQRNHPDDPYGVRTANGVEVIDIDIPMATGRAQTSPTGQWKIVDGLNREVYRFRPAENTRAKANELAALWARENNFDGNYQVDPAEDTAQSTTPDQQQGGLVDVAPGSTTDLQRQRATPGSFTGAWQILDADGNELHRFSGIGNVQSDANRLAVQWMRNNGYDHGTDISVVPIMG